MALVGAVEVARSEKAMKKTWKKPVIREVAAGMEITRYLPAEITKKR
jgi:coenzyme PQQ precursor peptide PqqA